MSPADTEVVILCLDSISDQINRYISPLIWLFGVVGNILNCLILSQRPLRSNSCALLFLISSIADLVSVLVGLSTRILAGWHTDPTSTITWICRSRAFIVFTTRTIAIWLITLATIDRWLSSSTNIRRWRLSSLKNVKRGSILVAIVSFLLYVHMLMCYEANLYDEPLPCYGGTVRCRLTTDLIYVLMTVTLPLALMLIFGLLTIVNVRRIRLRTNQTRIRLLREQIARNRRVKFKRTDHHLLRMLIFQMIFLILLCLPQAVQKLHITIHPIGYGSPMDDSIKRFLYNIDILLAFIASGMPFYINTLAGGVVFRNACIDLMQNALEKLKCC